MITLTLVYLVSCLGMVINRFYCCGKLASVSLAIGTPAKTNPDKYKCCKTEELGFKIKDNHVASGVLHMQPIAAFDLPLQTYYFAGHQDVETGALQFHSGNSPPGPNVAIYTFNCTYRI